MTYYLRQPVPVFVVLVPDDREANNPPLFFCSALPHFYDKKVTSDWRIDSAAQLRDFLHQDLPEITALWGLRDGIVRYVPYAPGQTTVCFQSGVVGPHEKAVFQTIRWSLRQLGTDILSECFDVEEGEHRGTSSSRTMRRAQPYFAALRLLVEAKGDLHFDNFTSLASWEEANGNWAGAMELLGEAAMRICEDKSIDRSAPRWSDIRAKIETALARLRRKAGAE